MFIGGEGLMKSKACLSEESQSDHMTLLRAFQVELVSQELNHLPAILHVYAVGLNFIK